MKDKLDLWLSFFVGLMVGFILVVFLFALTSPTDEEMDKIKMYDDLEQSYEDLTKEYNLLLIENRLNLKHIDWLNDQMVMLRGE